MIHTRLQKGCLLMAFIFIFLLSSSFSIATAQQRYSNITIGSSLSPTTNPSWLSPSGVFAFGFYREADGFAIGIFLIGNLGNTVVWTANRDDPPLSSDVSLLFTTTGLFLQGTERTIANPAESSSSASMHDSGNFVMYNSNNEITWQSFQHPADTILQGQPLLADETLFSSISETNHSTGYFRLVMQSDGNLVQYPGNDQPALSNAYWASNTNDRGNNVSLNLDDDGLLYLLNASGANILNLTAGGYPTHETIYFMKIDVDGILKLYSHKVDRSGNWSIIWRSINDKCHPKGLCGLNSYCLLNDEEALCRCLPGFDFVDKSQQNSNCERNFRAESCLNKNGSHKYAIETLQSVIWEDASYSIISPMTGESCKEACLEDCNCEAALFNNRECKKQKFPLRYARRSQSDSTIAYVKVQGESATGPSTESTQREKKKNQRRDILIVSVSLVVLSFVVFSISGLLIYRNHVWAYKMISQKGKVELKEDVGPLAFTYAELKQVTNDFKEEVGRGSSGTVFKGTISDSQKVVAVKKLEQVLVEGEREFQTEIRVIGKTHHRNLVRLLGYCRDGPNRLLVFEYMRNGSLADILFTPENQPSWDERLKIARDIARGILYLHEECETQIIHCDIKPQNILMDDNMHAKISDFGLAKLLKPDQTRTITAIRGTRSYVAPEWYRKLPVTVKADVYSFGIVLLEIICCRRCVDWSLPEDEAVLEIWVYDCFNAGELGKLAGNEKIEKRKLERVVKLGLWCIQDDPLLRPSINKVLLMLEGTVDIPIPPNPTSFLSSI